MNGRGSGLLLHISSLPSLFGIGDLGPQAYRFADFLAGSHQRYWQVLPLTPSDPFHDHSPYHSTSVFAGYPMLISPERLVEDGYLESGDLAGAPGFPEGRVDYLSVIAFKEGLLRRAYDRFACGSLPADFTDFCEQESFWLEDFALFSALGERLEGKPWYAWPKEYRCRAEHALATSREDLAGLFERERFLQYLFFRQWKALKGYLHDRGIQWIGDLPIYPSLDSADVWSHAELFNLGQDGRPLAVAGVPPDYFSETGQRWGNPLYDWSALQSQDFEWWVRRIAHNLRLYDLVRVDHFRGLVAFWEVPAAEKTAIHGQWVEAPAVALFDCLKERLPSLSIIAEDLGVITPEVIEVMDRYRFPGIKPLLFAFDENLPANPYIPHNLVRNCVACTGTHDNNTVRGWFEKEASPADRDRVFAYLGREVPLEGIHWEMIRLVMMSVADVAIFPVQDLLGLGEEARMNRPATQSGNWTWRLAPHLLQPEIAERLGNMTLLAGRALEK